jgi:hypothetical protein
MRSKQEKDALCRRSVEQGLGISALYPSAIKQIPELSEMLSYDQAPGSTMIAERLVTLPTHELVSDADLVRLRVVLDSIRGNQDVDVNRALEAPAAGQGAHELPRPR